MIKTTLIVWHCYVFLEESMDRLAWYALCPPLLLDYEDWPRWSSCFGMVRWGSAELIIVSL